MKAKNYADAIDVCQMVSKMIFFYYYYDFNLLYLETVIIFLFFCVCIL